MLKYEIGMPICFFIDPRKHPIICLDCGGQGYCTEDWIEKYAKKED